MTDPAVGEAIARVHREEWARVVATLARRFGDLDTAEEAAAEAFAVAVERRPDDGVLTVPAPHAATEPAGRPESRRAALARSALRVNAVARRGPGVPRFGRS